MQPMLWIPIGMGVLLGVGIGLAIAFGNRINDRGLMKTPSGKPIRWDRTEGSMTVYFSSTLMTQYREHWTVAQGEIERAAGHVLFMNGGAPIPELEDKLQNDDERKFFRGIIYVCDDEGTDPEHGRTSLTWDERTGFIHCAYVRLPEKYAVAYGYGIVLHEMMHALGFDHDATPSSIMWPYVQQRPGSITSTDTKLLRTVYGG
jgi:hypothetical protein